MSSINLNAVQKERLSRLGLIKTTTTSQSLRGYEQFFDPKTGAKYTFSPRGYVWRTSAAGTYQVNPRIYMKGSFNGAKVVSATLRTTEPGALTELAVRSVKNFRGEF
jgi:hypothetical protein